MPRSCIHKEIDMPQLQAMTYKQFPIWQKFSETVINALTEKYGQCLGTILGSIINSYVHTSFEYDNYSIKHIINQAETIVDNMCDYFEKRKSNAEATVSTRTPLQRGHQIGTIVMFNEIFESRHVTPPTKNKMDVNNHEQLIHKRMHTFNQYLKQSKIPRKQAMNNMIDLLCLREAYIENNHDNVALSANINAKRKQMRIKSKWMYAVYDDNPQVYKKSKNIFIKYGIKKIMGQLQHDITIMKNFINNFQTVIYGSIVTSTICKNKDVDISIMDNKAQDEYRVMQQMLDVSQSQFETCRCVDGIAPFVIRDLKITIDPLLYTLTCDRCDKKWIIVYEKDSKFDTVIYGCRGCNWNICQECYTFVKSNKGNFLRLFDQMIHILRLYQVWMEYLLDHGNEPLLNV